MKTEWELLQSEGVKALISQNPLEDYALLRADLVSTSIVRIEDDWKARTHGLKRKDLRGCISSLCWAREKVEKELAALEGPRIPGVLVNGIVPIDGYAERRRRDYVAEQQELITGMDRVIDELDRGVYEIKGY